MPELLAALLEALEDELPRAVDLRHRLHRWPEPGHEEHRTAEAVAAELAPRPVERVAGPGLLVRLGPDGGRAVALRAEMDGLPIQEGTGVPFTARNGRMHACGHDVHMAALVAVVRAMARLDVPAPLVALFQPSEETYPSGAERVVAEGVLDRHGVGAVLGVHVHPEPRWGTVSIGEGPVNASVDNVRIVVVGSGGHSGYPHTSRDPVLALAHVVVALQHVVSRRTDPLHGVVLSIGVLRAGSSENVIPERAEAAGTLRAIHPEDRGPLREVVREVAESTARAYGCAAEVTFTEGEPALVNDARLAVAVEDLLPRVGLSPAPALRSCGADDFGYFRSVAPVLMAFLGLRGHPEVADHPLHHPRFLPPDEAVGAVARAFAAAYCGAAALPEDVG